MWSPDGRLIARLALVGALALALGGCFRPVYGGGREAAVVPSKSVAVDVETVLKSVDVKQIEGRVGAKLRNELIFLLRGGDAAGPAAYRVSMTLTEMGQSAVVDPLTSVPESRTISLKASYVMTRAGTLDPVARGEAFATATYFSGLQRFANVRAERDAEDRAATRVAEQIQTRLRAFFAAGR